MALDLTTVVFSDGKDEAVFADVLDVAAGPGPFDAISNEGLVDTLDGKDLIDGRLSGTIDTADAVDVNGIRNVGPGLFTGPRNDTVFGEADFTASDLSTDFRVTGLLGDDDSLLNTGSGGDRIEGRGLASGTVLDVAGIREGTYETEHGDDRITGHAEGTGGSDIGESAINGITDALIDTGDSNDKVVGYASAVVAEGLGGPPDIDFPIDDFPIDDFPIDDFPIDDLPIVEGPFGGFFVEGIEGGEIYTGLGRDEVNGMATATVGMGSAGVVLNGLDDLYINTDFGNDKVIGTSILTMEEGSSASADGIDDSEIETFEGRDLVSGSVEVEGEDFATLISTDGIDSTDVFSGVGNDTIEGSVVATLGDSADVDSVDGLDDLFIITESGQNVVTGTVDLTVGANSLATGVDGIDESFIVTGDGNDVVSGAVSVQAGANSEIVDADGIDFATIFTGDGRDRVEGTSNLQADSPIAAFGSGITFTEIYTGDNADEVIGIGADLAVGDDSFGLRTVFVELGSGNDEVFARGASGGVSDVEIFGEDGDDIFDLHSGDGFVDGGGDDDLLILDGESADFVFTNTLGLTGNITDNNGTDLDVAGIEQFEFDDGRFDFGDLF